MAKNTLRLRARPTSVTQMLSSVPEAQHKLTERR